MRVNFIKAALSGVQLQEAGMCLAVVVSKLSFVVRFAIYIGHSRVICRFVLHILQKKRNIYIYAKLREHAVPQNCTLLG